MIIPLGHSVIIMTAYLVLYYGQCTACCLHVYAHGVGKRYAAQALRRVGHAHLAAGAAGPG